MISNMSVDEINRRLAAVDGQIAALDNKQMAAKILMNSLD